MSIERLINDNPNLSGGAIERLVGVSRMTVSRYRPRPIWSHSGCGVPYLSRTVTKDGLYFRVQFKGRNLFNGTFDNAIENVNRLIYCLENNNGKLPRTLNQVVFDDLEFIKG